jgi:hypothetical protein
MLNEIRKDLNNIRGNKNKIRLVKHNEDLEFEVEFEFPRWMEELIPVNQLEVFSIKDAYFECIDQGKKGKDAVDQSLKNHFEVIKQTARDLDHAFELVDFLQEHIEHRLKHYTKCITKSTDNYLRFLIDTYNRQLRQALRNEIDSEE